MNLSQGRDAVRERGFDGLSDSRCNLMLNAAKNTLEDYAPWPWLEESTSGTTPLTISDLKSVLSVWRADTVTVSLSGADRRFLRETFGPDLTTTGDPEWWYLDGMSTLTAYPVDSSVTVYVEYLKRGPELSADSDEPLFPVDLAPVWVDLACIEAYEDADEPAMAVALQQKVDVRLARAVDVYFGRNLQGPEFAPYSPFNHADS